MNFIADALGFSSLTKNGKTRKLEKGDIDENGLIVGEKYYTRDIKSARRRHRKHLAAARRKDERRQRRAWMSNQREASAAAVQLVRAHEALEGVPAGTLAGRVLDVIEAQNKATLRELYSRADALTPRDEEFFQIHDQIDARIRAGLRPSGISPAQIVEVLDLEDIVEDGDVVEPVAV